ncbi:MAG: S8 family serine peptidase [Syntrophobacteraceae bacterium]
MQKTRFWRWLSFCVAIALVSSASMAGAAQATEQALSYFVRLPAAGERAEALGLQPRLDLDYGSFRWLELSRADYEKLAAGRTDFTLEPEAAQVRVRGYAFNPLAEGEPALPENLLAQSGETGLHLIKLAGPAQDAWLKNLEAAGLRVLQYYPHYTYLVWGNLAQLNASEALNCTRWQGAFHPAYKFGRGLEKATGKICNVAITFYNDGNINKVLAEIEALGGGYIQHFAAQPDHAFYTAVFTLYASRLADVARLVPVWSIEYLSPRPGFDDEKGAQIVAGNYAGSPATPSTGFFSWLTSKGIDGSGITWADVDTGVNGTHPDIAERTPVYISYETAGPANEDPDGHGSHTAGAIYGNPREGTELTDPDGFYWGMGAAPQAGMVIQNALNGSNWPPIGGWQVLGKDSVTNGAIGSSNSWYTGASGAQGYSAAARTHDFMVRDANFETTSDAEPIIMVFSAGNAGPDASTLTEPKEAKNLITVGATDNYPRTGSSINGLGDYSSRGPALDGRLLPNVTAPGSQTASWNGSTKNCGGVVAGDGAAYYNYCTGTSMATPFVSGAAVLIADWWGKQGRGTPSPAMTKALLINGATDMAGGTNVGGNIPNNNQGWGRVNLRNVIDKSVATVYHDQNYTFQNTGDSKTYQFQAPNTTSPVKVTLVWTDAPGAAGASPALVNDLNLTVVTDGKTYRGNVFSDGWSTTGGSYDALNNIENVFIQSPGATMDITVTAANIAGDGVPYSGDLTDQDFALVIRSTAAPSSVPAMMLLLD